MKQREGTSLKRIFRRNQIIIAALAIMIAVAGYLNYSGKLFGKGAVLETSNELTNMELLDISDEDVETTGEIASTDTEETDGEAEGTPGEAVLTNGNASSVVAEAKVTREQVRAKNKESLMEIIDNTNLSDAQKQDAVDQLLEMTTFAEKEAAAETMLASKGFKQAVVSLTQEGADIVVSAEQLSEADRAQIEDIVTRKTGVAPEKIVITPIGSVND